MSSMGFMPAAPTKRSAIAFLGIALVVAAYATLAFVIFCPKAVYTVDIGVKYVQAESLVDSGFHTLDIPYRAAFLDPDQLFIPLRPPYVMTLRDHVQAIWPATTALFNGVW